MSNFINTVVREVCVDGCSSKHYCDGSVATFIPFAKRSHADNHNAYAYSQEFIGEYEDIVKKYDQDFDCTAMLNGVTHNADGYAFRFVKEGCNCCLLVSNKQTKKYVETKGDKTEYLVKGDEFFVNGEKSEKPNCIELPKKPEEEGFFVENDTVYKNGEKIGFMVLEEVINDIFFMHEMFGASKGCLSNHFSRTFRSNPDNTLVIESFFPTGKNACLLKCMLSDKEFSEAFSLLNDKEKKELKEFVDSYSEDEEVLRNELQNKCIAAYKDDIYAKMSGPDALKVGRKLPGKLFLNDWNKYRLVHYVNGLMCAALHDPRVLFIITRGKLLIEANHFGDGTWARKHTMVVQNEKDIQRLREIAKKERELVSEDVKKCLKNPEYMLEIASRPKFEGKPEDATYTTMVTFGYMFCHHVFLNYKDENLRNALYELNAKAFVRDSYVDVFMDFFRDVYFKCRHFERCRTLHESSEEVTKKAKY